MLYSLLKPLLFKLPAEYAHHTTLKLLRLANTLSLLNQTHLHSPKNRMGLTFPNSIGLAAGLDTNADYVDALGKLGFGFIEVGGVTPRPQIGNPKPRLFRLIKDKALINRMKFPNKGIDYLVNNIKHRKYNGILGVNLGKNFDVPNEQAHEDYCTGIKKVYPYADYITINISSPNTKNLRELQEQEALNTLLDAIKQTHHQAKQLHSKHVPLVLKIAPDLSDEQIATIAKTVGRYEIDGVIATNSYMARPPLKEKTLAAQEGGLSGQPLTHQAAHVIKQLRHHLPHHVAIIGLGGTMTAEDAKTKIDAGADLIQLYTGLVYRGPRLIKECFKETINERI